MPCFKVACLIFTTFVLAYAQSAVLSFDSVPNPVTDGQAQAITYRTNDTVTVSKVDPKVERATLTINKPITITLKQGDPLALSTVYDLTSTATGGQYIWTPRSDLPNGNDYALQISQGGQTNYYGPFRVQGYVAPVSSSFVATMSATMSGNMSTPAPGTGTISMGTASSMLRNTTFVTPTLAPTTTTTTVMLPNSTPAQTSATAQTSSPVTTGGAGSNADIMSAIAVLLAFGAFMMT